MIVIEARCVNEHCGAHQVWILLRAEDDLSCRTCGRPLADRQEAPAQRFADPSAEPEPGGEDKGA